MTGKTEDREVGETKPVELPAHSVQSEDEVVRAPGGGYVRVYAADYQPFTDEQVDQLVGLWQTRPVGSWVHVHCAAGQGRTTQALVLFDMRENAGTTSFQDIVDRQKDAGGINVLSTKSTPGWRHDGEVRGPGSCAVSTTTPTSTPAANARHGRAGRPGIPSRRHASSAAVTFGTVAFGLTL